MPMETVSGGTETDRPRGGSAVARKSPESITADDHHPNGKGGGLPHANVGIEIRHREQSLAADHV
jgi:hypothetical protein